MEFLYRTVVFVSLVSLLVRQTCGDSDESQTETVYTESSCTKLDIPGYPEYYIETYGYEWDTAQCPALMTFDIAFCDCVYSYKVTELLSFAAFSPTTPAPSTVPPVLIQEITPPTTVKPEVTTKQPTTTTTTSTTRPTTTTTTATTTTTTTTRPTTTTTTATTTTTTTTRPTTTTTTATTTTTTTRPTTTTTTATTTTTRPTTTPTTTTTPVPTTTTQRVTTLLTSPKPTTTKKPKRRRFLKILFHLDSIDTPRPSPPAPTPPVVVPQPEEVQYESGVLSRSSICSGCKFDGGVGYKNHERDCDKYVMCSPSGISGSMRADVRICGVGEYWDQTLLTCRSSKDVPCSTDKCKTRGNWYTYSYKKDCRAYWKCENGVSIGHCCPKGQGYVTGSGCVRNPSCNTTCGVQIHDKGCDKRPVPGKPHQFRQTVPGHGDIDMDCAAGTVFNKETCDCQLDTRINPTNRGCKKELDLSFSPKLADVSGKNVYVSGMNVTYEHGAACFHGDGAIVVSRFANVEIGRNLDIDLRFKASRDLIGDELQAVVYNGDCGMDPSIVVALTKHKVIYSLRDKDNHTSSLEVTLPMKVNRWMTGKFTLHNDVMSMTIDGRNEKRLFFGSIDRSRCGLKIGWGKFYDSFTGCVNKMSVSFCPKKKGS